MYETNETDKDCYRNGLGSLAGLSFLVKIWAVLQTKQADRNAFQRRESPPGSSLGGLDSSFAHPVVICFDHFFGPFDFLRPQPFPLGKPSLLDQHRGEARPDSFFSHVPRKDSICSAALQSLAVAGVLSRSVEEFSHGVAKSRTMFGGTCRRSTRGETDDAVATSISLRVGGATAPVRIANGVVLLPRSAHPRPRCTKRARARASASLRGMLLQTLVDSSLSSPKPWPASRVGI